jgi:hypothetical protein
LEGSTKIKTLPRPLCVRRVKPASTLLDVLLLAARPVKQESTKRQPKHQHTRVNFVLQALRLRIQILQRRRALHVLMDSTSMKMLQIMFNVKIVMLDSVLYHLLLPVQHVLEGSINHKLPLSCIPAKLVSLEQSLIRLLLLLDQTSAKIVWSESISTKMLQLQLIVHFVPLVARIQAPPATA